MGPDSKIGGKREKSASKANNGVWGGVRVTELCRLPPPQSTTRLAWLADFFWCFISFFAFSPHPHYRAWCQANVIMVLQ